MLAPKNSDRLIDFFQIAYRGPGRVIYFLFGRPSGTCPLIGATPNAEALGYIQPSLRDEEQQILVTLDAIVRVVNRPH